ncbi:unnamed protein product [Penicillium viridicatum]
MEGISAAANVVGVIQLAGSIAKICGGYLREVKNARNDIVTLQQTVTDLELIVERLNKCLQGPCGTTLALSSGLVRGIASCHSDLETLKKSIDPGKGKDVMRRFGIRALRWPIDRREVDKSIQNLERYKSSFILFLQIDQTTLLTGLARSVDLVDNKLPIAYGAEFDSYTNQHEDKCLPGTRTELLCQIVEWARSPGSRCIYWLNGMAGTGKSTISRTVATSFKEGNLLGASFFFKRGEGDRGKAIRLFSTIARQIIVRIPQLVHRVQEAMRDDPSIAEKSLSEQFEKLILRPLVALERSNGLVQSLVIVIDALDECEQDDDIPVILQLIQRLRESNAVLIKVFLTSRPELPIRLGFSKIANHDFHSFALHQVPEAVTELDISLFLKIRIAKIRIDRDIPLDWPGDDNIERLIVMSVPLFISAATICRFIEDPKWEPTMRLRELLQDEAKYATKMEKTYLPILTRLLHDQDDEDSKLLLQQFHEIVGLIILLAIPLSVNALSRLIGFRQEVISNRLDSFQSVLNIPHDPDLPVRVMHLSFRDFLVNTSSKFHVDEQQTHKDISKKCLATMSAHLRKNICNLTSYGAQRAELSTRSINHYVPSHLQYSCRYWVYHLTEGNAVVTEIHNVFTFLLKHLLHWVETMSILGLLSETVQMINTLQSAIQTNDEIDELLHDAKRFVLKNRQIADDSPLQLYCSGLVFAPRMTMIRRKFERELPDWIHRLPEVEEAWSALQQTLEGHSTSVRCVSFSPDGRIIASGSFDATIKLWNPTTGSLQHTLEGHLRCVRSVSFSPDNRVIASGSEDTTVRLWDRATGNLQQILEGHLDSVQCIAFSPDGRFLASGSDDQTIKLWDTLTGAPHRSLQGHLDSVTSVVFSPDCLLLASGSDDATIRIWDAVTGTLLHQPLEGHSAAVNSVAFSPDCRLLATGSDDATTRIWDTTMGTLLQTLEGHSGCVDSVVFSPDGLRLASGSEDATVRLWDIATGILRQTLEGHSDWVTGVVFSPDGRLLVSFSYDTTVKIWGTDIVSSETTWKAHASWVESLAFSPDGQLLASGSYDKTIQLRHTDTGITQQILEGHLGSVQCLRFSQDGRLLASGSEDQTIRLWDTSTGALQQTSNVQGTVAGLDFSEWESHLIANMNSLVTQSSDGIDQPRSYRQDPNIGILERQWVTLRGVKALWLPPEYRPSCSLVKGEKLALGHASGRISLLGFDA